jgi:hypothetical protein
MPFHQRVHRYKEVQVKATLPADAFDRAIERSMEWHHSCGRGNCMMSVDKDRNTQINVLVHELQFVAVADVVCICCQHENTGVGCQRCIALMIENWTPLAI